VHERDKHEEYVKERGSEKFAKGTGNFNPFGNVELSP
jgi:hypothetical protein